MAEQVPAVCALLTAIEARDWASVEAQLDPAVHWTTAIEEDLRGPAAVIAVLRHDPPPAPPSLHEVVDGRIARWIDCPG
jgi:limonene-1,2-epoxide hydrolase